MVVLVTVVVVGEVTVCVIVVVIVVVVGAAAYSKTRLFSASATQRLPEESNAAPEGKDNPA